MRGFLVLVFPIILFSPLFVFGQKAKDTPLAFEDDLEVRWEETPDTIFLVATNKIYAPLEVILNRKGQAEQSFLVPAKSEAILIRQSKVIPGKKSGTINLDYRLGYHMGHPDVIDIDEDYLYTFPFEKGKSYLVGQSWGGRATHGTPESYHAIDFQLDQGEIILAARGGTVVKVIDWFTKQGGAELSAAANEVVVLHEDGTMASYVHLQYQGAFVKAGDQVKTGDRIGKSGATGYSSGPHLHFVVRRDKDQSIPIYFKGHEKEVLKRGEFYQH